MTAGGAMIEADAVVIGAGAAGCVAAARLSEDPARRVVLLEAGRDLPPGEEPAAIRDVYSFTAAFDRRNHWPGLTASLRAADGTSRAYEQARIMGGGTSINGQQASIGLPVDYDDWAAGGAAGWSWRDVRPWFERLMGEGGIFPVSTVPRPAWPPFSEAFATAAAASGLAGLDDPNATFADGWFALPTMSDGLERTSAAMAYLPDGVRARRNLTILTDSHATTVRLANGTARGVDAVGPGGPFTVLASRVVLAAGAIGSPLLLQRSGIGPGDWLAAAGIGVAHVLEGVGANLQEHPSFALSGLLARGQHRAMTPRRHIVAAMRLSSQAMPSDLYVVAVNRAAWHAVGWRIASLFGWVNKPLSRGYVRLRPGGAAGEGGDAEVALGLLEHPDDLARLTGLARRMSALMEAIRADGVLTDIGLPVAGAAFRAFAGEDPLRAGAMRLAGVAMDQSQLARRFVLRMFEPAAPVFAAEDETVLADIVRRRVTPGWHPVGTCRMGPREDPFAVVDPRNGAVHGLSGLHVVDASVMPAIPRANTALPTLMIAERLTAAMTGGAAARGQAFEEEA